MKIPWAGLQDPKTLRFSSWAKRNSQGTSQCPGEHLKTIINIVLFSEKSILINVHTFKYFYVKSILMHPGVDSKMHKLQTVSPLAVGNEHISERLPSDHRWTSTMLLAEVSLQSKVCIELIFRTWLSVPCFQASLAVQTQ
jgi:hypothetical protein